MHHARWIVVWVATLAACAEHAAPPAQPPPAATASPPAQTPSPRQWAEAGDLALDKDDLAGALAAYRKALAGNYNPRAIQLKLAIVSAALGDKPQALTNLEHSVADGLRAIELARASEPLATLHDDPRWPPLVQRAEANERQYRAAHASPDGFRFVTSDIARFWSLYDQLATAGDPAARFERDYLDAGSDGLHAFVHMRIKSGAHLLETIRHHPRYYAAIRPYSLQTPTTEPAIRKALREFKAIYDDAVFPDIYFLIGALSSGGTATPEGLLLGTEIFSRGPDVPSDELDPWLDSATKPIGDLPSIVVHEWVHFQQKYQGKTMLAQVIQEGSADFLASLVTHANFNAHLYSYGYAHEAALKQEFLADLSHDAVTHWLYNAGKSGDRPADLGYFIGYRITEAYYNRTADKRRAIAAILDIKDFDRFLADSGYATQP